MRSEVVTRAEERSIVFASSLGAIFESFDFFLYATLAPTLAARLFPHGNDTAALLAALAIYAAGFVARPFGVLVFGRMAARVGGGRGAVLSIAVMGVATALLGALPTYDAVGALAPALLLSLRIAHGLALGAEYGGAAISVAEQVPNHRRGQATSWIPATAMLGAFLSLLMVGVLRWRMAPAAFESWGWRLAPWMALVLLGFAVSVRLRLARSPLVGRFEVERRGATAPVGARAVRHLDRKLVLLAVLGATAGQGVVWYTAQFYALYFLQVTLRAEPWLAYLLVGASLLLATPFFVLFGKLSDRIGRLKIILAGCLLAALTYLPLFKGLTHFVNPALERFVAATPISVAAPDCHFPMVSSSPAGVSECDRATDYLTTKGLSFRWAAAATTTTVTIGETVISGWDEEAVGVALRANGYPAAFAAPDARGLAMALLILFVLALYATMACGPSVAFLIELFPARIRHPVMALPYHIGSGWFGGMLPVLALAMVASAGDVSRGLWYPTVVAVVTVVVGAVFLRETPKNFDVRA